MKTFSIKGTTQTPSVNFDLVTGNLEIIGRSIPENVEAFYAPLFKALDIYLASPSPLTTVTVQLEYLNTPSSVSVLGIFKKLEGISNKNKVIINWNYEDDDMMESGEDYQKVVKLPINLLSVKV